MCRVVKILLSGGIRGAEHSKCGHWFFVFGGVFFGHWVLSRMVQLLCLPPTHTISGPSGLAILPTALPRAV